MDEMKNFDGMARGEKLLPTQTALIALLNLSVIHWLQKQGIGINPHDTDRILFNPVRSSISQSTKCPRKERLLRFQSNSTANSDDNVQNLISGTILIWLEQKFAAIW